MFVCLCEFLCKRVCERVYVCCVRARFCVFGCVCLFECNVWQRVPIVDTTAGTCLSKHVCMGWLVWWRGGSGNEMGRDGWKAVLDAVEACPLLSSLNAYTWFNQLLQGSLSDLNLEDQKIGLDGGCVMGRFLGRSASTLTSLNLA